MIIVSPVTFCGGGSKTDKTKQIDARDLIKILSKIYICRL
jgi:hypothetical protein